MTRLDSSDILSYGEPMSQAEPFYISTAIAYPNGRPHIGHAYEAIAADVIARFQRLMGRDVFFQTGTDVHGLKMVQAARDKGVTARELADEMSSYFKEMDDALNISYDRFIQTSELAHYDASIAIWKAMRANDDIYLGRYEGWYSVRDEAFYDEKELTEGEGGQKLSPQGTPVEWTVEESWFFRLSKYQQPLLELYEKHPEFLKPDTRRNEVIRFVEGGLNDLSISRSSFDWGVPVPDSPGHVMYVWVDALTNYLTGLGYPGETPEMKRFWPADIHLIGKDIVRFHAVYWPAFLMSAGLALPKQVFGHGFLLNRGEKMSKSVGNVVDPLQLAENFGVDALRFFLIDSTTFGQDGTFSDFAIVESRNSLLSNAYGNLLQRVIAFVARKMNGQAPNMSDDDQDDVDLYRSVEKNFAHWMAALGNLELSRATGVCLAGFFECNRYIDASAPWSMMKTDRAKAEHKLATLICCITRLSLMMQPFTPDLSAKALSILQFPTERWANVKDWDVWGWYAEEGSKLIFENPLPIIPTLEIA